MLLQEIPELDVKGLRQFGLILGSILVVIFGLLMPWRWHWNLLPNWYWIGSGVVIFSWALIDAGSMRSLYRSWMRIALIIGTIVNSVILAIIFYLVITPIGVVNRFVGKDPMLRSWDPNVGSYRIKSKVGPREHMERIY